ncbi:MAG: hypothetical protein WD872_13730 [Pirellulaceae bacterium]
MEQFISRVEQVFDITGRGLTIWPGIPHDSHFRIKIGDALRLRLPDGSDLLTHVAGIEMITGRRPLPIPLLLPLAITRKDIPIGTEVFHIRAET